MKLKFKDKKGKTKFLLQDKDKEPVDLEEIVKKKKTKTEPKEE